KKRLYDRAKEMLWYYRYDRPRLRFSLYKELSPQASIMYLSTVTSQPFKVSMYAYAFMPNHFHFLLRQERDGGITGFLSAFSNSYAKYFNTKYKRVGSLFQGAFKAVHIENDEQLLHVSRYIHLNPVTAFLTSLDSLSLYPWTSFPEYVGREGKIRICTMAPILTHFKSPNEYASFIADQAGYHRSLEEIKQVTFEE
ncbi:transposase, partial [Candidatus Gottesmanbacteria bacterium]|nr:transposase [Candidatus Gottesmanbacteria bacterium]